MDKEEVWGFIVTLSMCAQAAGAKQEKSARHCRRQSHSGGDQSEINAIAMEIKSERPRVHSANDLKSQFLCVFIFRKDY
jgi:hypothetical protein